MIVKGDSVQPFDFEGLSIRDYTAGEETRSSLAVIEVPPGAHHREAWSARSEKYYYVAAGRVRFHLGGETNDLGPGDFCLVRQGQRFAYENPTETTATLVLVHTPGYDAESERFVETGGAP